LKEALVELQSYAKAWRITLGEDDPEDTILPLPAGLNIKSLGGLTNQNGDYTIKLSAVAESSFTVPADAFLPINGKVINQQVIARDGDATAKKHYVVAANNVSRTTLEAANGIAKLGMDEFIDSTAHPVAYEITGASRTDLGISKTAEIDYVIAENGNGIPSPVVPGEYIVKLTPVGQPTVICEIT
jgi:hypothetical protein